MKRKEGDARRATTKWNGGLRSQGSNRLNKIRSGARALPLQGLGPTERGCEGLFSQSKLIRGLAYGEIQGQGQSGEADWRCGRWPDDGLAEIDKHSCFKHIG